MKHLIIFFVLTSFFAFVPHAKYNNDEINTKVQLGEKLFFDPILSKDSTLSCGSCHKPEYAFADNVAISPGVGGKKGTRNAPSVMNMAFRSAFFYDGRAESLRDQVHFPIEDPLEMDLPYHDAVQRLQNHKIYSGLFNKIYTAKPNAENLADAIAAFEESLETSNTEFDAWMTDKPNTMSASAIRGRELFLSDKAKCFDCHFSPDFTVDEFKNIGLYDEKKYKDKGRFMITKNSSDLGKFKVPGLRNVAVTAPYMHDGSFATLEDVVDYYSDPFKFVSTPINMDSTLLKPINFTQQEKDDLVAFLKSLTDKRFYQNKM
ncbi:MAG: cytochrome-c peroxidase [Saprospiraceae bacterium]|nr:cytochrome-c peroxidase [Saprospiraceae bacterium]